MLPNRIISLIIIVFFTCTIAGHSIASNLPPDAESTLAILYNKYKNLNTGKNADYIPELAKVNSNYFAIAIVTVEGEVITVGDSGIPFAIESVSKPFIYGLALQDNGEKFLVEKIGLNATGRPFNSIIAIEENRHHLQNPLVNAGALQVTSTIKGASSNEKWERALDFLQELSDGKLYLGKEVYHSEMDTNQHNRAIVRLLESYNMMYGDPADALDRYTKACSVMATAVQLGIMGATLANDGVNPITKKQVLSKDFTRDILSTMVINGLYENSGKWWWMVGVPAKSGVSGVILAIVPDKMAIVVYSPPLDEFGNSVRAQAVIIELAKLWNLHLLAQ